MKQVTTRKQKPIQLEMHKGCLGCTRQCVYNGLVTTKFKNQSGSALSSKYKCNTSKK
jgi:hypothetical protein